LLHDGLNIEKGEITKVKAEAAIRERRTLLIPMQIMCILLKYCDVDFRKESSEPQKAGHF